jgi:uncharacterized membrane protein YdjX (TVP38/TMEM64 family)
MTIPKVKKPVFVLIFFCAIFFSMMYFPVEDTLLRIHEWKTENYWIAVALVGITFVVFAILLLPASLVVMLSGFLFGLLKGLMLIWVFGLIASALTFWMGRTLARTWVSKKIEARDIYVAIDRAVSRNGLWVVLLARLALIIPYGPLNYSLGLSGISFSKYWVGTNIGMMPAYFLVVYLGDSVSDITALLGNREQVAVSELLVLGVYLFAVSIIAFFIMRSALIVLTEELDAVESNGNKK